MQAIAETDLSWEHAEGRILTPLPGPSHYTPVGTSIGDPRVLQLTQYDPGSAAYRYHSAFNSVAGGVSAFVRFGDTNPHCDLRQFDGTRNAREVREMFEQADVVHVHMDYTTLRMGEGKGLASWPRTDQLLVRHYHGSELASGKGPPRLMCREEDDRLGAVHVGARLYHHRLSDRMHWIPIPMPCEDYRALARTHWVPIEERPEGKRRFRIAHSATNRRIKGTDAVQCAVLDLQARGVPVELVLILDKTHDEALRIKATCDATFDSFWLGIQGSGLEGAAMGQPVIAGDRECRAEYEQHFGECPYTFANDYSEVGPVIERLVMDADWRAAEAARVGNYVRTVHDYPIVGAAYWAMIAQERMARGLI